MVGKALQQEHEAAAYKKSTVRVKGETKAAL